ncbi:MAG TPA: D-alanyl-D-alanine carboxypeptidase/D-alanyl-D-alanine-endopeptidase [Burkholderiales bacterium]|nr:D-alanyl-D-alanine carboxypeptidase/D-alanyl-D-alanine-endopeptidase [Burkholderiales bacterium]
MLNVLRFAARLLIACGLALASNHSYGGGALPAEVASALRAAGIPESSVAVVVQRVGAARPTLSLNAGRAMNPASVMKLVTTYAALELLGPAYRWKTEVYASGAQQGGVLDGQLILKGYGDPHLTFEDFWRMLLGLRERGLRELRGDLVLDRSWFEPGPYDPAAFDGKPFRPYNVGPDALLLNFNSLRFEFLPDAERGAVQVIAEPRPPALDVENALRVTQGPCGDWEDELGERFDPISGSVDGVGRLRAFFGGSYALSCGEKKRNFALFAHRDYVAGVFRQLWEQLGGSWTGAAREGELPEGARLVLTHESPPLGEIVRYMNKFSNNVMARQLYLTLAAESAGPPARPEAAGAAVAALLARQGLAAPELVMDNGSGLSRDGRISAATLAKLLQAAFASPVMPEFVSSLPIAGLDGTLRKYMKDDPVAGRAHVKTGSLSDARAIAGYIDDRSGRRQVVVMLVNHEHARDAQPAMEALLRWTYARAGPPR